MPGADPSAEARCDWGDYRAARARYFAQLRNSAALARLERAWSLPAHERGGSPEAPAA